MNHRRRVAESTSCALGACTLVVMRAPAAVFAFALTGCTTTPAVVIAPTLPPEAAPATRPAPVAVMPAAQEGTDNPWATGETWTGHYVCPQGPTALQLHVLRVQGLNVDAVFDFEHAASGASGQFEMNGHYDPGTRRLHLVAGDWLARPPNYVTVDLDGRVSSDGRIYSGWVSAVGCGTFLVRREK
jgi:hypothetical protein